MVLHAALCSAGRCVALGAV